MGCTESTMTPAEFFSRRCVYIIPKKDPNLRLAVSGNGNQNGTALIFFPHRPNDPTQKFLIHHRPDIDRNAVNLAPTNILTRYVDTTGNPSRQFVLWDACRPNNSKSILTQNQTFVLERAEKSEEGLYFIRWKFPAGGNLYVDNWGDLGVNSPVVAAPPTGLDSQKFYLQLCDYASPKEVPSQSIPYFNQNPSTLRLPQHSPNPYETMDGMRKNTSVMFPMGSRGQYRRPNVAFLAEGAIVEIIPRNNSNRVIALERGGATAGTRFLAFDRDNNNALFRDARRFKVHYRYGARATCFLPVLGEDKLAIDMTGERRKNLLAWTRDERNQNQSWIIDPVANHNHFFYVRWEKNQSLIWDVPERTSGSPFITRDSRIGGTTQQFKFVVISQEQLDSERAQSIKELQYSTFVNPFLVAPSVHYQRSGNQKSHRYNPNTAVISSGWDKSDAHPTPTKKTTTSAPKKQQEKDGDDSSNLSMSSSSSDEEEEKKRQVPPHGSIVELVSKIDEKMRVEVDDASSDNNAMLSLAPSHGGFSQRFEVRHRNNGTSFALSPLCAPRAVIDAINSHADRQQVIYESVEQASSQCLIMEPLKNEDDATYFFFKLSNNDDEEDDYFVWHVEDSSKGAPLVMRKKSGNNNQLFKLVFVPETRFPREGSIIEISPRSNIENRLTMSDVTFPLTVQKREKSESNDLWKQRFIAHVRQDANGENFLILSPVAYRDMVLDVLRATKSVYLTQNVFKDASQAFVLEASSDSDSSGCYSVRWSNNFMQVMGVNSSSDTAESKDNAATTTVKIQDRDGSTNQQFHIQIFNDLKIPDFVKNGKDNNNNNKLDDDVNDINANHHADPLAASTSMMMRVDSLEPGKSSAVPTAAADMLSPNKVAPNSIIAPRFALPSSSDVFEIVPVACPEFRAALPISNDGTVDVTDFQCCRGSPIQTVVRPLCAKKQNGKSKNNNKRSIVLKENDGHDDSDSDDDEEDTDIGFATRFTLARASVDNTFTIRFCTPSLLQASNNTFIYYDDGKKPSDLAADFDELGSKIDFQKVDDEGGNSHQLFSIEPAGVDEEGDACYLIVFHENKQMCWTFQNQEFFLKKHNQKKALKCQRFKFSIVGKIGNKE